MNLIEALQQANDESREFLRELDETAGIMGGYDKNPGLQVSRTLHRYLIKQAEDAIASGDTVAILRAAVARGVDGDEQGDAECLI